MDVLTDRNKPPLDQLRKLRGKDLWTIGNEKTTIRLSDGPHGVRKPLSDLGLTTAHPATCFPAGCALACSWDVDLMSTVGQALARECEKLDIQVLLGPGLNLKRHPGCGRNLEYFSEDPLLSGKLAAGYVNGVQNSGNVVACLKHFAVNNQESHRMVVDAIVDERTLRELYLANFEYAIQNSNPKMIMGAYNKLNGIYCCENQWLLETVLREEWKWGGWNNEDNDDVGICVTDWGATNNRAHAIAAGMDLEMPGSSGRTGVCDTTVHDAVQQDRNVDVTRGLHHCSKRMDAFLKRWEKNENDTAESSRPNRQADRERDVLLERAESGNSAELSNSEMFDTHHDLAYRAAMECAVLLQNNNNFLPLEANTTSKIAVIGAFAKDSRYQGMGSSHVTPTRVEAAYDNISRLISEDRISFAAGYDPDPQSDADDQLDEHLIQEAEQAAKDADAVLLFLGIPEIFESEGFDREHLRLPQQQILLLDRILSARGNQDIDKIAVVLSNGGAIEIPSLMVDHCSSILEGYLWGQAGAKAVVDLVFGIATPCGKLPETFAIHQSDIPSDSYFPGNRHVVEYREGLDMGYRYFDSPRCPSKVRFPFGHGLSYAEFAYKSIAVKVQEDSKLSKRVSVQCEIVNSGTQYAGKEIVQCYVAPKLKECDGIFRPYHELRAFTKSPVLKPGDRKSVQFELDHRAFAVWDIGTSGWVVEAGDYEIQIGSSSQDIRLKTSISFLEGEPVSQAALESYPSVSTTPVEEDKEVRDDAFFKRFGEKSSKMMEAIEEYRDTPSQPGEIIVIHRNTLMKEAEKLSLLARLLHRVTIKAACSEIKSDSPTYRREVRMIQANVDNLPLRGLVLFSKGMFSFECLDALVSLMNGSYLTAFLGFGWMFRCWVLEKFAWFLWKIRLRR